MKNITEVVFILDRSGSMGGLEADTIGGYNSMLAKQKEEEGEVIISTVLFDDRTEVIHNRLPLNAVKPITDKEYYVRGCTALLDAVGGAIHHIGKLHKEMPEEERPDKTLFFITTDGFENSSRFYSYDKVKKMIEKKKKKNHWEFVFIGANIDAVHEAGKIGISENRAVRYECDSEGTNLHFATMSKMVSCARKSVSACDMDECFDGEDFLGTIREDYAKRHR